MDFKKLTAQENNLPVPEGAWLKPDPQAPPVLAGSPADKAGLKAGDIVIEVNGEKVTRDRTLADLLQKQAVGETISLTVLRDDKELMLRATLTEREF